MIYILGSNGMLGRYVYDYLLYKSLYQVTGLTRNDIDVGNLTEARNKLETIIKSGDVVINCMGITNKRPDISLEEMYIVNSIFPHIIDRICQRKQANLIHPSTDCVFTGKVGNYDLNAIKDEESDYGLSKSIGENLYGSVIRVSIIGEEERRQTGLLSWCQQNRNKIVNGFTNHFWNGVTCLQWAKLVDKIIRNKDFWQGVRVYQSKFKGENFVSKANLVRCISETYNLNIDVVDTETKLNNKTLRGEVVDKDLTEQIKEMYDYRWG